MKKKQETKSIIKFFNKLLFCTVLFLAAAIISKSNNNDKEIIKTYLYNNNINFTTIRKIYNKYLGGITSIKEKENIEVFNEKINYNNIIPYEEGAKLEVTKNYLIPNQEEGIVVNIGKDTKYKNIVVVENDKGIDTLYGNICNSNIKLYDNIDKNTIIGESCDNYIYIVYKKGDIVLDYKNYLS